MQRREPAPVAQRRVGALAQQPLGESHALMPRGIDQRRFAVTEFVELGAVAADELGRHEIVVPHEPEQAVIGIRAAREQIGPERAIPAPYEGVPERSRGKDLAVVRDLVDGVDVGAGGDERSGRRQRAFALGRVFRLAA